ncbi:MAG TPA: SGNH/GDSL hydrolase family protein [Tepidisphaeraceae bacterium]|nr:SGNH/GDSL hydrolase family protein [Tepidisphaeraceae bacterium]
MKRVALITVLAGAVAFCGFNHTSRAADEKGGQLKAGDYVAIIGDSITEQKQYSVFIEDYLLMCQPAKDLKTTQFGWGGETSWGFDSRMVNDMTPFGATVATINFGMNDGGYRPETPQNAKHYHDAYTDVVEKLKKAGVRFIVVGSPGCVDSDSFHKKPADAEMYNQTLNTEREIAKKVAQEQGAAFADVYGPMVEVMSKAKEKYGHGYVLAGGDGVHPNANGHLVMAYAYLKGLGCDGNIGTITVDLDAKKAEATDGHKILSDNDGTVEVESTRYPFCFSGDPKSPNATTGVLEFFPFNQDLNRFTLVVKGADSGKKYKVTWGKETKEFAGADLAKGINLAAEFLESPFADAFKAVDEKVRAQQNFETPLVKQKIHDLLKKKAEGKEKVDAERTALIAGDKPLQEESSKAVVPVKHTIKVEEAK